VKRPISLILALAALVAAGCGDDEGDSGGERPELTVSAAASLKSAFEDYAGSFDAARVRFSFAGSDELAAQIRQGAKPDVYAAANTKLPDDLFREGRIERPEVFAGNRLVLAVPKGSTRIDSLEDLAGDGVKLVIGDDEVPVGSYAGELLDRLPARDRDGILANVRSAEPDVLGIVGKLTQGAADAGFLYITDVAASDGELEAIELPESLQPSVRYGIAVVKGSEQAEAARRFIDGLLNGAGLGPMRRAGFEPPP
jgi:molybdate transport system substrate-binding protein